MHCARAANAIHRPEHGDRRLQLANSIHRPDPHAPAIAYRCFPGADGAIRRQRPNAAQGHPLPCRMWHGDDGADREARALPVLQQPVIEVAFTRPLLHLALGDDERRNAQRTDRFANAKPCLFAIIRALVVRDHPRRRTDGGKPCPNDGRVSCLPLRAKSAIVVILVSNLCDCRPPRFTAGFLLPRGALPGLRVFIVFRWLCALFFALLAIVPAAAAFLPPAQCLAL
jgi:hypothetical protein